MTSFGIFKQYCGQRIGNYKIIQRIGEGRYGVCFLAEDESSRHLIIKKLKPSFFKRNNNDVEIKILSGLCHPGIPKLLGVINEKSFYALLLELKAGDTVESMLFKQKHRFSDWEIYNIGGQIIDIIRYLHEKGIVHRDIRIPNVLVNNGMVSLVDFGLARWEDQRRYTRDIDFAFLGDLLLYLLYSNYKKEKHISRPWYEELSFSAERGRFLKRLLKLEEPYQNIHEVARVFREVF